MTAIFEDFCGPSMKPEGFEDYLLALFGGWGAAKGLS